MVHGTTSGARAAIDATDAIYISYTYRAAGERARGVSAVVEWLWRWWIQQHYHLKNCPPAPFFDCRDTLFENVFARMLARTFETRAARPEFRRCAPTCGRTRFRTGCRGNRRRGRGGSSLSDNVVESTTATTTPQPQIRLERVPRPPDKYMIYISRRWRRWLRERPK